MGEDSRTNAISVLPRDSSDPLGDVGPTDSGGLTICPQDTLVTISDAGGGLGSRNCVYTSPAPVL